MVRLVETPSFRLSQILTYSKSSILVCLTECPGLIILICLQYFCNININFQIPITLLTALILSKIRFFFEFMSHFRTPSRSIQLHPDFSNFIVSNFMSNLILLVLIFVVVILVPMVMVKNMMATVPKLMVVAHVNVILDLKVMVSLVMT